MKNSKRKIYIYCPEVIHYLKNKEDAYTYSICSDKKITVKCPECGYEHIMIVKNLTRRHYSCPKCGGGTSFPEKIMMNVLDELNEPYIYQLNKKQFNWCGKYKYDFYLIDKNIILEIDGAQHYCTKMGYKGSKTLKETIENDNIKNKLAKENGVNVIHINCSYRSFEKIKCSILHSLNNILKLENIDWCKCLQNATKSKIYEVCKKWEEVKEYMNTEDLSNLLGIPRSRIVRYLHQGNDVGFCTYDGKYERKRASKKGILIRKSKMKHVLVYDKDNNYIDEFDSAKKLSTISKDVFGIKFTYVGIIDTCKGKQKSHKNFKFKYKE